MVSFPQVSPPRPYTLLSPARAACRSNLSRFYHPRKILDEQYKSLSSSLCSFLHSNITSSLLGPNILLNILFSNTPNLRYSLNVNDQVWHPNKTQINVLQYSANNRHHFFELGEAIYLTLREHLLSFLLYCYCRWWLVWNLLCYMFRRGRTVVTCAGQLT